MKPEDIDGVCAIEARTFPAPWSRGMFAEDLARENDRVWFVVESGGVLLGYVGVGIIGDEAHIMNIALEVEARGQGLGGALLARAIDAVRAMGISRVTLEVRERNLAAIGLYEAAGLHEAGKRRGYYQESGEDAIIMWSDDLEGPGASARLDTLRAEGEKALAEYSPGRGEELVLGIETSCDESAASVMRGGTELLSSVVASQVDFHSRFGGVVPEIASRKHTEAIVAVVEEAMARAGEAAGLDGPLDFTSLDCIAVTHGPGLVGALVVGLAYAKGLSFATGVPLVGVNHLEGHVFANVLADPDVKPPLVALLVSGGHTSLVHMPDWGEYHILGETLDDAAGEAFDKVAKVLGLGYPGGPVLSRLATDGNPAAIDFPRAMLRSGDYAFSLSGLKTAVINHIRHEQAAGREIDLPDLAASFQQAVIDVQVAKSVRAAQECGVTTFCLGGGVAANVALRTALHDALAEQGISLSVPPFSLCTDNAAMIAAAGTYRFRKGERLGLEAEAVPGLRLDD